MVAKSLVLLFLSLLFVGCEQLGLNEWTGFFYKKGDTFNAISSGPFKYKDECLAWARSMVTSSSDDYECGKNCKGVVCAETVDG